MKRILAELRETLLMAFDAIATHKLRSGLTLLGVLVGVFSIILVMTAMRAMQNNIEKELGQLGSKTFAIQRMPGAYFGGPEGFMKFLRRNEITFAQALAFKKKAAFAPYHRQIRPVLGITDEEVVVCGMALGYEDTSKPEASFRTDRAPLEEWVSFVE